MQSFREDWGEYACERVAIWVCMGMLAALDRTRTGVQRTMRRLIRTDGGNVVRFDEKIFFERVRQGNEKR